MYRLGLVVKASLENSALGLTLLLELELGSEEVAGAPAQLVAQLEPELSELGELVTVRHQERRKTVDIRLQRQQLIQDFDHDIRGVVRMAQGMFRLASRSGGREVISSTVEEPATVRKLLVVAGSG